MKEVGKPMTYRVVRKIHVAEIVHAIMEEA
jgi:hypothetical protein